MGCGKVYTFLAVLAGVCLLSVTVIESQATLPSQVGEIFADNCTICHNSRNPQGDLDLSPESAYGNSVNIRSSQKEDAVLVAPGNPGDSYLIAKVRGGGTIEGDIMPPNNKLPAGEIAILSDWVASLQVRRNPQEQTLAQSAFADLAIGNLPTTASLDKGRFVFKIGHRFAPKVSGDSEQFFGIDGPASIMLSLGYALTDNAFVSLGRSNQRDAVEIMARYMLLSESPDTLPFSLGLQGTVDRNKIASEDNASTSGTIHLLLSTAVVPRTGLAFSPAVVFNPDPLNDGEDPLVALGFGGRYHLGRNYYFFGETSPVVAGFPGVPSAFGMYDAVRRYDSWSVGVEKNIGVHVFQVFLTNAEGLAVDQSLSGGDMDIGEGEMRLGFTISVFY